MEVLTDVLTVLRTGRPFAARFAWRAPWGRRHEGRSDALGVYLMVRGTAIVTDGSGRDYRLGEGDALLMPRASSHTMVDTPGAPLSTTCTAGHDPALSGVVMRSDPAAEAAATHAALCFSYELAPGRSHPMLSAMPDFVHLPCDPTARPELAGAVAMLDAELRIERAGGEMLVRALLDAVLMYLLRASLDQNADTCPERSGWAAALADEAIGPALSAIHDAPARQWTVASLGATVGLSRSAFSRRFAELVGQPPLAYLTSWRMTLAARLLTESDAPLSAVARQVGYASEFAFAAAFKRAYGLAPGRFRDGAGCDEVRRAA